MGNTIEKKGVHHLYTAHNDIILALIPLIAMGAYMYGMRVILLAIAAAITAVLCDFVTARVFYKKEYDATENSSMVIALVLTMMFPASIDFYIVVVSVIIAIMIGKYIFGGIENYTFNPVALGFAVSAVCWQDKVFAYPAPFTQLPIIENVPDLSALASSAVAPTRSLFLGGAPNVTALNLLLGNFAGGLGVTANIVIFSCFILLLVRKRVSIIVPSAFVATCCVFVLLFPRIQEVSRLQALKYEILSSTIIFAAVFILADLTTLPKNKSSRLVYGVVLGIITMLFSYYGSFEIGICFAVLSVNAISGWLDRMVAKVMSNYHLKKALANKNQTTT